MSNKILIFIFLFSLCVISAIGAYNEKDFIEHEDHNKAIVNSEKGILLFIENKPLHNYIELGNIKAGATMFGTYTEFKAEIIRKCLKNYPGANGLIFNIEKDLSQATAIKFE